MYSNPSKAGRVGGWAASATATIRAIDGTPWVSSTNSMYRPGGARFRLAGAVTSSWVPERVNGSSMKRCSMLKLWVTEPVLIRVTRAMPNGLATPTAKPVPTVSTAGACRIRGRGAHWLAAVNR